jgi:hypothetical protein
LSAVVLFISGCASVVNDSTQVLKVDAKSPDGSILEGTDCKISNDRATVIFKSGETTQIPRSASDLDITCKKPGLPDAYGRAISRANGGMWGNVVLGGGIGALVDHNRGNAYSYPEWIQVVFGQSLIFDKSKHQDDPASAAIPTGPK